MHMENNDRTSDLQEMRARLDLLERRIKDENIVNEKLLRHIMSDKAEGISTRIRLGQAFVALGIPYTAWVFHHIGFSLPLTLVTCLFLLSAFVYDHYTCRLLRTTDFAAGNLMDASRHMIRVKRLYARWLYFSIPFVCVWLAWLSLEAFRKFSDMPEYLTGLYVGVGCGLAIGGCIGFMLYRKTLRTVSEILRSIREITGAAS